jgi:hypothetical protein
VWKGPAGVFEGKKLDYQNKWSLDTRSWSEAQSKTKDLEKRLKDFAEGKVVPKGTTVEAALQEWYKFRDQNKLDNTKAKQIGEKLVEWCEGNDILLLTALTTDKAMKWRLTLPYLILETKGYDPLEQVKADAARRWVNAMNAMNQFGSWEYVICRKPTEVVKELARVGVAEAAKR